MPIWKRRIVWSVAKQFEYGSSKASNLAECLLEFCKLRVGVYAVLGGIDMCDLGKRVDRNSARSSYSPHSEETRWRLYCPLLTDLLVLAVAQIIRANACIPSATSRARPSARIEDSEDAMS
jgi:hypothetical protein